MITKINDIEKALENKAYLSALALALTIPDICGKLEYPKMAVGERYKKWYNDYFADCYRPRENAEPLFTAEQCYKLRCAYLHEGKTEAIVDEFELCINGCSSFGESGYEGAEKTDICLNVEDFCRHMCATARYFYDKNKDKYSFKDVNIKIIDIEKEYIRWSRF